jgi:hypothetical protein
MTIIQRRVFYGKVGTADRLVEWAREMYGMLGEHEPDLVFRIMTDYQSGRTDRLAVEVETESMAKLEAAIEKEMTDPKLRERFGAAFSKLESLIDYAEVEQWRLDWPPSPAG